MLPRYAYDYSKIEPLDEYEAKQRVIASLARHYDVEDPAKYYDNQQVTVKVDTALQSIEKIRVNVKSLDAAVHVQSLGRGRETEVTFLDAGVYPEYVKILEKMPLEFDVLENELKTIFKDITFLQMTDLRKLVDAFDKMYAEYEAVLIKHTNFRDRGPNVKAVKINKDGKGKPDIERLRDSWQIVENRMDDVYALVEKIVMNYNERRNNLFSRTELAGGAYRGYNLSTPETYAPGEFI